MTYHELSLCVLVLGGMEGVCVLVDVRIILVFLVMIAVLICC